MLNCQDKTAKNNVLNVDPDKFEFVEHLSDNILKSQKSGGFYPLSTDEASPKMISELDEKLQKETYLQIKDLLGHYESLKFHSMVIKDTNGRYEIYRFKGGFKLGSDVEVRAVLDTNGKLAGFFVIPWKDAL
ncbi:DUF3887 domain-containing protein [Algibacter sp. L4_22]|uniref:DUF3887 domain-containing protein n=1 Tax=Algibacter sp. L4_22 TaxID=2942477 RepID=UPI00201B8B45|nr:DUF3887 domain-containing protein [Algibacter sp. L4_22]MCL5127544.1 DUF3887 domain-containing protein [Algibacter sp. L4_22]